MNFQTLLVVDTGNGNGIINSDSIFQITEVSGYKMRIFGIVPELRNYRLMKIGFWGHQLYVSPCCTDRIQIWSLHSFIPNSWSKLFDFPLIQLFYSFYAVSPDEPYIYALVVALFVSSWITEL